MEFNQAEVNVVERTVNEIAETEVRNLKDLQLALVGGGIADPLFL